jgi:hypothetical protein
MQYRDSRGRFAKKKKQSILQILGKMLAFLVGLIVFSVMGIAGLAICILVWPLGLLLLLFLMAGLFNVMNKIEGKEPPVNQGVTSAHLIRLKRGLFTGLGNRRPRSSWKPPRIKKYK